MNSKRDEILAQIERKSAEVERLHNALRNAKSDLRYLNEQLAIHSISPDRVVIHCKSRISGFSKGTNCVYFLRLDSLPGLIKIGFTHDLSARVSALKKEFMARGAMVVAWIEHENHKTIESALHNMFDDYRAFREWFEEAPVLEFLKQYSQEEIA